MPVVCFSPPENFANCCGLTRVLDPNVLDLKHHFLPLWHWRVASRADNETVPGRWDINFFASRTSFYDCFKSESNSAIESLIHEPLIRPPPKCGAGPISGPQVHRESAARPKRTSLWLAVPERHRQRVPVAWLSQKPGGLVASQKQMKCLGFFHWVSLQYLVYISCKRGRGDSTGFNDINYCRYLFLLDFGRSICNSIYARIVQRFSTCPLATLNL